MGKLFSKQKKDKTNVDKKKEKAGKNNPHNVGSTQSLNEFGTEVSHDPYIVGSTRSLSLPETSYNPTGDPRYDQPVHHAHTLQKNHAYGDRQNQPAPALPSRHSLPPVPAQLQENRVEVPSRPYEEIKENTNRFAPPRNPPPPLSSRQTENRRRSATVSEDDEEYLKASKEKGAPRPTESKKPESDNFYFSPESHLEQKVRAEKNYAANFDSDVSFNKGDILLLIKERETADWYFVRNLTTEKEGYAPKDWVTLITGNDVESQKCFFKDLDRDEAVERLSEPEVQTGTYLFRPSADAYALSLRCENDLYEMEIRHYRVRIADKGICYIEADSNNKPFGSITELIRYYTDKPGLRCKLKSPLPQDATLNDLAVKFSDLKLGEVLGSGNFGSVYAGTLHKNKQVAVKSLKEQGSMTVEQFRKEAETMHKLHHQNLVSLLGICEHRGKILIITERMSKGALLDLLREDTDHTVKFKDLMHMAVQIVNGMCYLEKKGFIHRDLRAANVLVGDGYITKIADFGLARLLDNYYEHEDFYQDKKGSVFPYKWTAPEAIKKLKFTVKSDVWSFGILLYEMVTHGDEPYAAMRNSEVLEWVESGNRLQRPKESHCPATLFNIMTQCWKIKSEDRPNFADIKEMLVEIKTIA